MLYLHLPKKVKWPFGKHIYFLFLCFPWIEANDPKSVITKIRKMKYALSKQLKVAPMSQILLQGNVLQNTMKRYNIYRLMLHRLCGVASTKLMKNFDHATSSLHVMFLKSQFSFK